MSHSSTSRSLPELQAAWKHLFQHTLPDAACAKSNVQPTWPVHVDHCFARIILDNVVGIDTPWMAKVKSPAWKNLTEEQLRKCIKMGEGIMDGHEDLVDLDANSLRLRGKKQKLEGGRRVDIGRTKTVDNTGKNQHDDNEEEELAKNAKEGAMSKDDGKVSKYFTKQNLGKRGRDSKTHDEHEDDTKREETQDVESEANESEPAKKQPKTTPSSKPPSDTTSTKNTSRSSKSSPDMTQALLRISKSNKTPFQKQVLNLLCQIPPGQYSTYGLLSTHLSSSPRAVGNALRNNPFAPEVPCHRILATGGGLGGFGGSWGKKGVEGINDDKKRKLLRDEGVKFDGKGKVVGSPWSGFK